MSRRTKSLANQILEPVDFEKTFNNYIANSSPEQTVAYLDGAVTIFTIIEDMMYPKKKDGTRLNESRDAAYFKISHFIIEKGELLDRLVPKIEKMRQSINPSDQNHIQL
jgi:hypothetical protein